MINTVINDVKLGYIIDSAKFSTHPNLNMGAAIKGRLQRSGGFEIHFNTYAIFHTKPDDRFAFAELSGFNYFILSRSELDITRENFHDLKDRGVKVTDIDRDVKKQLISEILAEINYSEYTLSHTKEIIKKPVKVSEELQVVVAANDGSNGRNSAAYKAVTKKKDEYHSIQKDIKAMQKEAAELRKQWEDAKQVEAEAGRSYFDAERRIQGMLTDIMGIGEQVTELSIAHAKER